MANGQFSVSQMSTKHWSPELFEGISNGIRLDSLTPGFPTHFEHSDYYGSPLWLRTADSTRHSARLLDGADAGERQGVLNLRGARGHLLLPALGGGQRRGPVLLPALGGRRSGARTALDRAVGGGSRPRPFAGSRGSAFRVSSVSPEARFLEASGYEDKRECPLKCAS